MSSNISIDTTCCLQRIQKLYSLWRNSGHEDETGCNDPLHSVDAIIFVRGEKEDNLWFFGYEWHNTLIVFCQDSIIIYASSKTISCLKQIATEQNKKDNVPQKFQFYIRTDHVETDFIDIIKQIKQSYNGQSLGILSKDKARGAFDEQWQNSLKQHRISTVDIDTSIIYLLARKDDKELALIRRACNITNKLYVKYFKNQILQAASLEKKIRHSKLSAELEAALVDEKILPKADFNNVQMCYPAIIQSGGNYELTFTATSNKNLLHYDGSSIICALGARYKFYCSNLVRTLLVNPCEEMRNMYQYLVECEELIIRELKHNVQLCDVYKLVRQKIENERPELINKVTKNFGTLIGITFQEPSISITKKCMMKAKKGMTFQVNIGFSDLKNPNGKDKQSETYALFIGDTVLVNENEPCTLQTISKKEISHITIISNTDISESDDVDETLSIALRRATTTIEANRSTDPKEYQKCLLHKLNERAQIRLTSKTDKISSKKIQKVNHSYQSEKQLPHDSDIQDLKLYVDKQYETVILPIYGISTPFHISMIKNVSLTIEGEFIYLRLNLFYPVGIGKQTDMTTKQNIYIKELTYRTLNETRNNLSSIHKSILEIQKKYKDHEQKQKQSENIVKQASIILNLSRTNHKLKDLYIRPTMINKKTSGTLEVHQNAFRYTSIRGDKIDILYSNIVHAFYQSCDNEMIILIHFHLKDAIVIGKRKEIDVQFYTEVGELTIDLGKHRNIHEIDDILIEQAERDLRKRLQIAFQSFIDKVIQQKNSPLKFQKPIRSLGFHGVPYRSMVLIIPTTTCVVQLTEWKWLTSCEICYTEGPKSLNWKNIMTTIINDPNGFFAMGGWKFLEMNNDDELQVPGDVNESDAEEEDHDPHEDEGSQSEYSDEDEDEENSEEDEIDSDISDEESGKSWSELEEEAKRADEEISNYDLNRDERSNKTDAISRASNIQSASISKKRPAPPSSSTTKNINAKKRK
ncbi:hypothetical protein I4U23_006793 [Adineta vaga]|nr:hypothetical protein I4U23_006793 [Adineta vaga]